MGFGLEAATCPAIPTRRTVAGYRTSRRTLPRLVLRRQRLTRHNQMDTYCRTTYEEEDLRQVRHVMVSIRLAGNADCRWPAVWIVA